MHAAWRKRAEEAEQERDTLKACLAVAIQMTEAAWSELSYRERAELMPTLDRWKYALKTPNEESGLRAHGLNIGMPSQLSDAFRQGVAWGLLAQTKRIATLEQQNAELVNALKAIKGRVCGEAMPNWENTPRTGYSRGWIADKCDVAIAKVKP